MHTQIDIRKASLSKELNETVMAELLTDAVVHAVLLALNSLLIPRPYGTTHFRVLQLLL
jgi:hypothetical protein